MEKLIDMMQTKIGTVATSSGSIVAGVATYLKLLPVVLGCLASITGIVLSVTLIHVHIKRNKREREKSEFEHEKIRLEIVVLRKQCKCSDKL